MLKKAVPNRPHRHDMAFLIPGSPPIRSGAERFETSKSGSPGR
jgi:hypothetical protein